MSEQKHPIVMCDGDDGMCGEVALDHTLGGLATLVGSPTQLPPGWSGDKPGSRGNDEHYCPHHATPPTTDRAADGRDGGAR